MFEMWKLNWKLWVFKRNVLKEQKQLAKKKAPDIVFELAADKEHCGVKGIQEQIDLIVG